MQKQIAWNQQATAEISKEADRLKKEYRIRRKVEVCILPDAMHSTIGLRHPVIILGGVEENADDMELILRHELLHIRRCDFLARALAEFVKTLHWFNPLAYLLARELADVMEYACDDRLMAGADTEKRKRYATLLAVQMEGVAGTKWSLALARRKSLKRKRVERIMKERKQSRIVTAAVGILVGLGVCVNSMQALAYEDIIRRDSLSSGFQDFWIDGRTGFFVPAAMVEEEAAYWRGPELLYEEQFVDEEGNIWQVMEQPRQTYASCSHSYADGTYTEHEAHADGSCTVYRYSARRCAKCGNVTGKALSNTIDYNPCIHKLYK